MAKKGESWIDLKDFADTQRKWIETGGIKGNCYWNKMFNIVIEACKVAVSVYQNKRNCKINNYDDVVLDAACRVMNRIDKNHNKIIEHLLGYCHCWVFATIMQNYNSFEKLEKYSASYEQYIENFGNEIGTYDDFEDDLLENI